MKKTAFPFLFAIFATSIHAEISSNCIADQKRCIDSAVANGDMQRIQICNSETIDCLKVEADRKKAKPNEKMEATVMPDARRTWLADPGNKMTWEEAGRYCGSVGAMLPAVEEIQEEVRSCGGMTTGDYFPQHNEINNSYQSCMQSKGWNGDYWTRSQPEETNTCAFDVGTKTGGVGCGDKVEALKVRCIKK
jgi:hypothetical protein